MIVYAVDLGTTNIKVLLYDERLRELASARAPMRYRYDGARVEFDPDETFDSVVELIHRCASESRLDGKEAAQIVVTGQAESLVMVDGAGAVLAPGISWLDARSDHEATEMRDHFAATRAFAVTGQPQPVATWPATKLRWLSRHRPDVLAATRHVLMIKDYVLFRLTGAAVGEETTRGFTYYYDVGRRRYWEDMLAFCGTDPAMLGELVPAGTDLGPVLDAVSTGLPRASSYGVNAGALDHFCAMVGTDSYRPGHLSASGGTVLSLSLLSPQWRFDPDCLVSFHPGLRPDETVLFTCADSGGVSLTWLQENIASGAELDIEGTVARRRRSDAPLFLPYLTGVNPPDFDDAARGAFLGLRLDHDLDDLAYAVLEGVAHLLRRNLDYLLSHGEELQRLVSTGGGASSAFWNQLKADATGMELHAPAEPEASCRGAAVLALVAAGVLDDLDDTTGLHTPAVHVYRPQPDAVSAARYRSFDNAVHRLASVSNDVVSGSRHEERR